MRIQAKIQLKNYEMVERRKSLGYTFAQIQISTGINAQRLSAIENLRTKPTIEEAEEIATVLNCNPSILFPNGYEKIVENLSSTSRSIVAEYTPPMLEENRHIAVLNAQMTVTNALSILSDKEKRLLELRHGLNGNSPMTLEEAGREFGVTRERIRQIEAKANEKIRVHFGYGWDFGNDKPLKREPIFED